MANTHTYKVTDLQRDANDEVVAASFTIEATDGVDSFTHQYHTAFKNKPATPIAFADITEAKVIEWIKRNVGTVSEEQADSELAAYKERKEIKTGMPW
jgi:phage-related tail protein